MMGNKESIALERLSRDPLTNADMIESVRRGDGSVEYAGPDGVFISLCGGYVFFTDADKEKLPEFTEVVKNNGGIVVAHGDRCISDMHMIEDMENQEDCFQVVWTRDEPPEAPSPAEIKKLTLEHLDMVSANYGEVGDREYISDRIECGAMFGAFIDGELIGFIGIHGEGAMGMLFVLPEYRRLGVGLQLEAFMIASELSKGHRPYGQIFRSNEPSIKLAEKIGFSVAPEKIAWFGTKED